MNEIPDTRRSFVKKAAYVAPAILSLVATPAFAKSGSEKADKGNEKGGTGNDDPKKPKKSQSGEGSD